MFYSRRLFYGFTALASFAAFLLICRLSRILQNKEREIPEWACPRVCYHAHKHRNFHRTEFSFAECRQRCSPEPSPAVRRYILVNRGGPVCLCISRVHSSDLCSNGSWRPSAAREKDGSNLQKMAGRSSQWNHERSVAGKAARWTLCPLGLWIVISSGHT